MKTSTVVILLCYTAVVAGFRKRIANHGEKAKEKEFPYQVSLRYDGEHFCGGALITKSHVLTAAHCVRKYVDDDDYLLNDVSVEVGMIRRGHGKVYKVNRISCHPKFKNKPFKYDLAVIHLTQPVNISDEASTIKLPKANSSLLPGTTVFVSGFGADDIGKPRSQELKMMDAEIVSNEECQKYHGPHLILGNICAAKGKDYGNCEGDSGGPLVDETKTTIIGVVSGGDSNCTNGTPDIYTKISRYIPYIKSELNYDAKNPRSAAKNPAINLND